MFRRSNIQVPKPFVLVHVHREGSTMRFRAGKISAREKDLHLFDSIEEVVKQFGVSLPYILHVSGSGVLQRCV